MINEGLLIPTDVDYVYIVPKDHAFAKRHRGKIVTFRIQENQYIENDDGYFLDVKAFEKLPLKQALRFPV